METCKKLFKLLLQPQVLENFSLLMKSANSYGMKVSLDDDDVLENLI